MKKLLLLLILSFCSAQSFAKDGDVYYCEMKSYSSTSNSFQVNYEYFYETYDVNNFKFKWDNNNLIFSDSFISISRKKLVLLPDGGTSDSIFSAQTSDAYFASEIESVFYSNGNFYYSMVSPSAVFSVVAKCDKF